MTYGDTLEDYVNILAGRLRRGEITQEKFFALTTKLVEWENVAKQRGLM